MERIRTENCKNRINQHTKHTIKQDRTKQRDYNGITGQRGKRTAEQRVNMTTITNHYERAMLHNDCANHSVKRRRAFVILMDNGEKRRADPAVAGSGAAREEPPGGYKCPRCRAAPRRDRDKNLANARKREKERGEISTTGHSRFTPTATRS